MNVSVTLSNYRKQLEELEKKQEKAIQSAVNDCKSRAPAQVTKTVTAAYGIKAGEVTAAGKAAKGGAKTVGSIKIDGVAINTIQLTYNGRVLTPSHFSMTPKQRPEGGRKYTVKAEITKGKKSVTTAGKPDGTKGKKKRLGTGMFLAPGGGTSEIPFRRQTAKRLPIDAIRTVGIPQMITNEQNAALISERINELLQERVAHQVDRMNK